MRTSDFTEPGDSVLYEPSGQIAIITLNRPEALNAINRQLRRELEGGLRRFNRDEALRVAIITGAGRAFSAGRDLKERAEDDAAGVQARARGQHDSGDSLHVVPNDEASNRGHQRLRSGWRLVHCADVRHTPSKRAAPSFLGPNGAGKTTTLRLFTGLTKPLAAEDARLGITEPRVGLFPPFAVTLPKLIPMAAVMELVLTGEPVTAQRAYEMGFVNKVVPSDSLMDEGYWPILAAEWGAQVTGLKEQGEARWYSFAIALGAIAALSTGAWAVFRRKEL